MKRMLSLTLLLVLTLAAADDAIVSHISPSARRAPALDRTVTGRPMTGADSIIGRIDTIGGTTYDWQVNGPMPMTVIHDSGVGAHATWLFSADPNGSFPDRNMRYNFRDATTGDWTFSQGSSFMDWGLNAFPVRCGYGNIAVNPNTHCACVCAHQGAIFPSCARDVAPGSGTFEECSGHPVCDQYLWPLIAIGRSGRVHVALTDEATRGGIWYSRIDPWCTWSPPFHISNPDPTFPSYVIVASRRTSNVCIAWTDRTSPPYHFRYRISTDDGLTWLPQQVLPPPPAFTPGSDTTVSGMDLFPWYDPDDEENALHIGASFYPIVNGQGFVQPVELWHWTERDNWNRIARASCDTAHLMGSVGYNAVYATRPTFARNSDRNELVCVWEQFDSMNVEPATSCLRADVYVARGDLAGRNWGPARRITSPDQTSKRFPCVADATRGDTCLVLYEVDLVAGFAAQSQGPVTSNPMHAHWVPLGHVPAPAVSETGASGSPIAAPPYRLDASPNPFRHHVTFSASLQSSISNHQSPIFNLTISDASGRLVACPLLHRTGHDSFAATWIPEQTQPGIYFCRLVAGDRAVTRKITLMP